MTSPVHFSPTREQEIPAEPQPNLKTKTKRLKDLIPEDSPYFYSAHLVVKYGDDSREKLEIFRKDHPDIIKRFSLQRKISDSQSRKITGRVQSMSMLHMKIINAHSTRGKVFDLPNDSACEEDVKACEENVCLYPIDEKNKKELRNIKVSVQGLGKKRYASISSQFHKYASSAENNGIRLINRETAIDFNKTLVDCGASKKTEDVFYRLEKFKTALNEPTPTADEYAKLGLSSKPSSTTKKRRRGSDYEPKQDNKNYREAKRSRTNNTNNAASNNASNNDKPISSRNEDDFDYPPESEKHIITRQQAKANAQLSSPPSGMQNSPEPQSNATPPQDGFDIHTTDTQAQSPSSYFPQAPSNITPPDDPNTYPIGPEWEELWQLPLPSSPADNSSIGDSDDELPINDITPNHPIFFEPGFARGQAAAAAQWR